MYKYKKWSQRHSLLGIWYRNKDIFERVYGTYSKLGYFRNTGHIHALIRALRETAQLDEEREMA